MRVGDKVRVETWTGHPVEGVVVAVFPESEDANIRVRSEFGLGDYYEEELEVVS